MCSDSQPIVQLWRILHDRLDLPLLPFLLHVPPTLPPSLPPRAPLFSPRRRLRLPLHRRRHDQLPRLHRRRHDASKEEDSSRSIEEDDRGGSHYYRDGVRGVLLPQSIDVWDARVGSGRGQQEEDPHFLDSCKPLRLLFPR